MQFVLVDNIGQILYLYFLKIKVEFICGSALVDGIVQVFRQVSYVFAHVQNYFFLHIGQEVFFEVFVQKFYHDIVTFKVIVQLVDGEYASVSVVDGLSYDGNLPFCGAVHAQAQYYFLL